MRFTVLMTLDCVVVEFRCDSDLCGAFVHGAFVHVPATCMHENVMVRHVCDSFAPFLTPRPGTARVDCTRANTAPQRAPPFQCAEPCALLVAEGCGRCHSSCILSHRH